ncbi:DMT family transporter [Labrys sp. KNU-23]|uniref:DMT family transporter n=1 Tax=Labrys sp. KNU-23 TaxID=2789216 RepID=UPI0011EEE194|nr:DMT family transporter [Labrys sp. KNU-23]QEN87169.1 DMT family transporter [Labrys sp. KNU-23]
MPASKTSEPLILLLATGTLLGLNFPLGKLAGTAGIPPAVWTLLISTGCALVIGVVLALKREVFPLMPPYLRFYAIGGTISYAVPNFLVYLTIPHLGSGYTSIMFTLSPIITTILATALNARRPNLLGVIGILIGFIGAMLIVLGKGRVGDANPLWIGIGFLIPLSLAIGNVYRTLDWPPNARPLPLAVGTNLASSLVVSAALLLANGELGLSSLADAPLLSLIQVAASAAMFAVFFRLQMAGGPVYLSQIGYVAAAVGLGSGTFLLGEHYDLLTWLGAVVIAVGVIVTTIAQRAPSIPSSAAGKS